MAEKNVPEPVSFNTLLRGTVMSGVHSHREFFGSSALLSKLVEICWEVNCSDD